MPFNRRVGSAHDRDSVKRSRRDRGKVPREQRDETVALGRGRLSIPQRLVAERDRRGHPRVMRRPPWLRPTGCH